MFRQSIRELCSHWTITRNLLSSGVDVQLQMEVDRIVLLAVQHITSRPGYASSSTCVLGEIGRSGFLQVYAVSCRLGLWQFLVDLPYDCVSEDCRIRCEYFLRSSEDLKVSEIYDIPISEVVARNRAGKSI